MFNHYVFGTLKLIACCQILTVIMSLHNMTIISLKIKLTTIRLLSITGLHMTPAATSPSQLNTTAILLVLALGTFILGLSEFSMMPMLPLISETFASTPSQSGYAISAYAIGVVVGAPILMLTTANMKKRHALAIFLTLMFISNGLSAMATSLEQLIVFRFLSGLPHGAYFGAAILLAADIAPQHKLPAICLKCLWA